MAFFNINTVFNIDVEFETAPLLRRIAAYMVDLGILSIYLIAVKSLLYEILGWKMGDYIGLDLLIVSIPMMLYSLITETLMNGQTIGKKLLGIRVISLNGDEPVFGQYVLRWMVKFFEWPFLFGYIYVAGILLYIYFTCIAGIGVVIIIATTRYNQRIGDLLAGTAVIETRNKLSVADTIFMNVSKDYKVTFPEVMRLSDNDINTIKTVLQEYYKGRYDRAQLVERKVKDVLTINSNLYTDQFLEKLIEDYNFIATKE